MQCSETSSTPRMVFIRGGAFTMGASGQLPEERPEVVAAVDDFWISQTEITNDQFAAFVTATGYLTRAERTPRAADDAGSAPDHLPGSAVFVSDSNTMPDQSIVYQWQFIPGANWRHPEGPASDINNRGAHPVVHIAYEDALAFANWAGHVLPSEQQFEYVTRGGLADKLFAWGDDLTPGNRHMANTWQGVFPYLNTAQDGYLGTAPVGCYPANNYGVYDIIGNVWEWTTRPYFPSHHAPDDAPLSGFDGRQPDAIVKVIKGGSFLCAPNYCARYRPAARHAQDVTLGTSHIGFRTVQTISASTSD